MKRHVPVLAMAVVLLLSACKTEVEAHWCLTCGTGGQDKFVVEVITLENLDAIKISKIVEVNGLTAGGQVQGDKISNKIIIVIPKRFMTAHVKITTIFN